MAKKAFQRFIEREEKGAKKKERIRQEKKKVRQETKEYFAKKKEEARKGWVAKKEERVDNTSNRQAAQRATTKKAVGEPKKTVTRKGASQGKPEARPGLKASKAATVPAKSGKKSTPEKMDPKPTPAHVEQMPLNKFIAHSGICSRRDAAELVRTLKVKVNDEVVSDPGFKVSNKDEAKVNGKKINLSRNLVYILLNKPKDYITTMEDPEGRKTVYELIKNATSERVYPIGRLDRNTTGVLLFTNDGELAQKLSHPSYQVRKIYEVRLDKPLTKKDFDTLLAGITLDDGFIAPDSLAYADSKDKSIIGIEIHSGRNRIVRRMFGSIGYDVRNLDRVMFANLTKKNVERGKWRFLVEKEIRLLKYMNASYSKKANVKAGNAP